MRNLKGISFALIVIVSMFLLSSCGDEDSTAQKEKPLKISGDVNVMALKGSETLKPLNGLGESYKVTEVNSIDEISTKLTSGGFDIAVTSPNMAATLNEKSNGQIVVISPTAIGGIYLVGKNYIEGNYEEPVKYLNNRTINILGEGSTSEYILDKVIKDNYIYGTTLNYVKSEEELMEAMKDYGSVAVVTESQKAKLLEDTKIKEVLNLGEEWRTDKKSEELLEVPVTEVLVVSKTFKDERGDDIKAFIADYEKAMEKEKGKTVFYGSSNRGEDLLKNFYEKMFELNEESLGGKLPEESFYIEK